MTERPTSHRRPISEIVLRDWGRHLNLTGRLKPKSVLLRVDGLHIEYRTRGNQQTTYLLDSIAGAEQLPRLRLNELRSDMSLGGTCSIRKCFRESTYILRKTISQRKSMKPECFSPGFNQKRGRQAHEVPSWAPFMKAWAHRAQDSTEQGWTEPPEYLLPLVLIDTVQRNEPEEIYRLWMRSKNVIGQRDQPVAKLVNAFMLALMGFGEAARDIYTNIDHFTADVRLIWSAGRIAMNQEDWVSAFEHLRRAVVPNKAGKLREFASVAQMAKAHDAASKAAAAALKLAGRQESWWLDQVNILIHSGALVEAQRLVMRLVESGSTDGETIAKAGQIALALEDFTRVIELADRLTEPGDRWLKHRLLGAKSMAEGEYSSAIEDLEAALEVRPKDQETTLWLGEAYIRVGRRDDASDLLTRFDRLVTAEHPVAKLLFALITLGQHHANLHTQNVWYINRAIADDVLGPADLDQPKSRESEFNRILSTLDHLVAYRGPIPLIRTRDNREPEALQHDLNPRSQS